MANPDFVGDSLLGRLRDIYTSVVGLLTGIVLAAGTALIGKVGIDQATANANEVVLKAGAAAIGKLAANSGVDIGDVDILSITAGNNRIGTVSGVLKEVRVTKALAAATPYTANDVLCEDATTGVAWTFAAISRANGAYGYITGATIVSESENVTPRLTLFLFNAIPAAGLEDHLANIHPDLADIAKYIGKIDFPALESLGTTDSNAIAAPSTVGNLPLAFKCAADADDLIGVLVTRDAFTQTPTENMTIILTVEQY